jgi:hypothetical protein
MYAHICKGLILLILHPYEYILWKLGNLTKVFITLWIIRGIIDFTIIIATGILIAVLIALFWKTKVKNWHLVVGIIFSILLMSLSHFLNEKLKQTKSKGRKLDDCF